MMLTIEELKNFIDNLPGEYTVEFVHDSISYPVQDKLEVDLSGGKLILKSE